MNEKLSSKEGFLPARSGVTLAARILGFQEYEIPLLVRLRHLKPLGAPLAQNAHRYFCTHELLELARDREWLDKATRDVTRYWQKRHRKPTEIVK